MHTMPILTGLTNTPFVNQGESFLDLKVKNNVDQKTFLNQLKIVLDNTIEKTNLSSKKSN